MSTTDGTSPDDLRHQTLARATLRRAFERVRDRGGCRGADGVTVGALRSRLETELDSLEDSLRSGRYRPLPLMRFAVPKRTGGERFLTVPTVRDRIAQTAVYLTVGHRFEAEFEDSSFAYRKGRSVRDALRAVQDLRDQGYTWVLDADIDACFDSIPHDLLLERVARLGLGPFFDRLFRLWVEAEVYDGHHLEHLERGIPQGSVVSPMLSNLFLDHLDEQLAAAGLAAVRYADDFVILTRDEASAEAALELTDDLLAQLELELDPDKTTVRSLSNGLRFLGALFVGDAIYLPWRRRKPRHRPVLPRPLDLCRYVELQASPHRAA